ncbi:shikimate dehydrogenase [Methylopila turkensis]|uniref:Shikimate dehydrogenase (NADP(+)) n=1 Tax=Methylopila turkensis TaxID=1437816 RepID=A0A9W6JSL4_9HYPH|nr:shikimate dehydrogenase [Methylopila turkensis]GLK81569.1 shikimate dehydrogenase (NADP(+)) [Methylopila turkensis]
MSGFPRACVLGWPVSQSRSPLIHNHWLATYGLAGGYERAEIAPAEFESFVRGLGGAGFVGGNVTVPHKEAAFRLVDEADASAADLGAVNTLWFEDGRLVGGNTDGVGFVANLDEAAPGWEGERKLAAVIGAGGAARAVVHALGTRGFERVAVVNRTREKAEAIAPLAGRAGVAGGLDDLWRFLPDADLVVNATSLGMAGKGALEVHLGELPERAVATDLIYVPLETPFLADARARGLRTVDGLGMLLHQAAPGFERWFGVRPDVTPELRALVVADIGG